MTPIVVVSITSLLLTVIVGFMTIARMLGRIEQRMDLLWSWYLAECGPGIPGGRRRTDPAAPWSADDSPDDDRSIA